MAARGGAKDKKRDPKKEIAKKKATRRAQLGGGGGKDAAPLDAPPFDQRYPANVLATLFGVNVREVHKYVREGTLPPPPARGQYDLVESTRALLAWWQDKSLGRTKGAAAASERLTLAKAEAEELRTAEIRGELVPADEHRDGMVALGTILRSQLLQLPDRIAPELEHTNGVDAIREVIDQEIRQVLAELAATEVRYIERKATEGDEEDGSEEGTEAAA